MRVAISGILLLSALSCGTTCAQSNITLYGTVGAAIRSSTNADPAGKSRTEMTGTNVGTGWWGVRGNENLGGMQVRFKLESGLFVDTGAARFNALFGREASVGIVGRFGALDVGRLQVVGNASEVLVRIDPARGSGQVETVWPGIWTGDKYDNSIRYRLEKGPVILGAQMSLGEQAGSSTAGRSMMATAGYRTGQLLVLGSYQVVRDAGARRSTAFTLGSTYTMGPTTLHGAYLKGKREKDFLAGVVQGSALFNTGVGFAGIKAPAELDTDFFILGASVRMAPRWLIRSAYFYGDSKNATQFSATKGGQQRTVYMLLSHDLSPRTSLIASLDLNRWNGGWSGYWGASPASLVSYRPDGRNSRRTASLGMMHSF